MKFKPLIDPAFVPKVLGRPVELAKEFKLAVGQVPDGTEKARRYGPATLAKIHAEEERIFGVLTDGKPSGFLRAGKSFTISAGAPGAGKTTLLAGLVKSDAGLQDAVYVDPDETAMANFRPYHATLKNRRKDPMGLFKAYTQWRWASQYIAGMHLNRTCESGFDVLYGTSATAPSMAAMYNDIRENGYDITTIIVAAPLEVRHESSRRRYEVERSRYTTAEDLNVKGTLFNERLPLYFEQSDAFKLYWRDRVDGAATRVASGKDGAFAVSDWDAMDRFDDNLRAEKSRLNWAALCRVYTDRYSPR